jgi:DNA-binding NarL/FixJ family response regulator
MFTILIVEDHLFSRKSLEEMLHRRHPTLNVKGARDGLEALQMINAAIADLMFMDIGLPGANGLEIARKIKQVNPRVPIIILADYDFVEYRDAAYRHGADFFIPKSSSAWAEITGLVEAFLSKACLLRANQD